jgi:hypothetical protein
VVFRGDGTFDIYRVDSISWVWGKHIDTLQYEKDYHIINSETFLGNNAPSDDCKLIFIEDELWVEGEVQGKITIASADVTNPNVDTTAILSDSITYTTTDGSDGLAVLAQDSVLIPLLSPDNMQLRGIFIAQKGYFGRNGYTTSGGYKVPSAYNAYVKQTSLEMNGSIVSKGRVGTKWSGCGSYCSGYGDRENSYDRNLATDPPPLTPFTSQEYKFVEWKEEK